MLKENADAVVEAIHLDLGRPKMEGFLAEVGQAVGELDFIIKNLKSWMEPEARNTPLLSQPGKSKVVREPKGLVLNLTPWNFPINIAVTSTAAILSAGNCCVLKPSEVSPASEKFLKEMIPRYVDPEAVAVVTGGAATAKKLLELRWDHIMYTGNHHTAREILVASAHYL